MVWVSSIGTFKRARDLVLEEAVGVSVKNGNMKWAKR